MTGTARSIALASAVALALAPHIATSDDGHALRVAVSRRVPQRPGPLAPAELVVQFRGGADARIAERAIREAGGAAARRSRFGLRYRVRLDAGFTSEESLRRLRSMPEVEHAEANGRVRAYGLPNDEFFDLQWHLSLINAERTWDIQTGDPQVVVAVLDSGIAYEDYGPFRKAPDWGDTVFVEGLNVFTGDSHANDDYFHGTHVASIISEATNNGEGAAGLAHDVALMPVKVLDKNGEGDFFGVAEGIDYATSFNQGNGPEVKVINLSLGSRRESRAVTAAIDRAVQSGIVVVASAGNDGLNTVGFPASLANVIAVGAVDARKQRASYSSYGPELDIVAPGGEFGRDDNDDGYPDGVLQQTFDPDTAAITGRYDDFAYFFFTGTSLAAPHVAALAALLMRQGITDPKAVQQAIESTAEDLGTAGRDDEYGHGLIDPAKALAGLGLNR